jgi:hypothetical protein
MIELYMDDDPSKVYREDEHEKATKRRKRRQNVKFRFITIELLV